MSILLDKFLGYVLFCVFCLMWYIGRMILFTPFLFSVFYRLRGSDILDSTQLKRLLFWCVPCAIWAAQFGVVPAMSAFTGAYLGMLIPHGWAFGDKRPWHLVGMSAIGVIRLALILCGVIYIQPMAAIVLPLGAFAGLASWIGWTYFSGVKSGVVINGTDLVQDNTAWQELFTGLLAYGLPFMILGVL